MSDASTSAASAASAAESHDDFDIPLDAPESGPPTHKAESATTTPTTAPASAAAPPPQPGQENLDLDTIAAIRDEGLQFFPGETQEAATIRLNRHYQGKLKHYGETLSERRQQIRQHQAEMAQLRQDMRSYMEPILREHYRRESQERLELEAAQIPDRETDPEGYRLWVAEEVLRRDDERQQREWDRAQEEDRLRQESGVQAQLVAIDQAGYDKVAAGLGLVEGVAGDPDFAHAYDVFTDSAVAAARSYWPDASDAELQEFIALSQRLDIRRAEITGVDYREVAKHRLNRLVDNLVSRGLVARVNGSKPPASETPASESRTAPPPTNAQRVAADAAATARRAPAAVPSNTRPSGMPGDLPDMAGMDEDDYVEAALAGLLGKEEERAAPHRRAR